MLKQFISLIFCSFFLLPLGLHAKQIKFTIVQSNDVYEMTPVNGGKYGGLARISTLIKQLKNENPHTFTILAGDLFSPSAIGTAIVDGKRLNGRQMVDVLNAMQWDYITVGNHEFDNGEAAFKERVSEAKFTVVISNLIEKGTRQAYKNTIDTDVITIDGVRIGLGGILLQALSKDFVSIGDPLEHAKRVISKLRNEQNADIVLLITHQDMADDIAMAATLPGVDMILGGHEHENNYVRRGPYFTPVAKADSNGQTVYIHRFSYDTKTKSLQIDSDLKVIDSSLADDPAIKIVVDEWVEKAFESFRAEGVNPEDIAATSTETLDGLEASVRGKTTRFTELITLSALNAFPGSDLSLLNGGSIRLDDILPPGPVTQYDVIRTFPFSGSSYSQVSVPGDLLKQALDVGVKNKGKGGFLHHANVEKSENGWEVKGKPLVLDKKYLVAIASFLVDSGDAGLEFLANNTRIPRTSEERKDSRQALVTQLRSTYP
jgi:5'-nucleotidase